MMKKRGDFGFVFAIFSLFFICSFVFSMSVVSAICDNGAWEQEDEELGCDFEFMPCPDSFDGGVYEYWTKEDCLVKKIVYTSGEVLEYDLMGNLISEDYYGADNDIIYRYWDNGDLKEVIKDGVSTYFVYDFLSDNSVVVSDEITRDKDGNVNVKHYEYYEDGRLKSIEYLDEKIEYEYNSYGNVVKEIYTYYSPSDSGFSFTEWVAYDYDSNQNLVKMYDNRGYDVDMSYEEVPYECEKSVCTNRVCNEGDSCFDFTECDDNDNCQTYSCSNVDYVPDSCSYFRLKNRVIGNEILEVKYDLDGSAYGWCEYTDSVKCYNYTEKYDSEGFLVKDDYYSYSYLDNDSFVQSSNYYSDNAVTYNFDDFDGSIDNSVTQFNGQILKQDYLLNPIGELFAFESNPYEYGSSSSNGGIFSFIAPFTKNLLTGFSIFDSGYSSRYYVTGSSDISVGGYYSASDMKNLLDNYLERTQITLPEDSYFEALGLCLELNNSVEFNGLGYYDFCSNNLTLKDYYCGLTLRADVWNLGEKVLKSNEIKCEFGCNFGRCLEFGNVTLPSDNYTSDLPPEPDKPSAI